jgi:hypothetical protein
MHKILWSFVLLVALVACAPKHDYNDKISHLQELLQKLENAETTFNALPHDSVKKLITYLDKNLRYIEEYYPDTLNEKTAEKFFELKILAKAGTKGFRKHYYVVENELPFTQTQIRSLVSDLQEGKIDTTKAKEYYEVERTNANYLIESVKQIDEEFTAFPDEFYRLKPYLDSLRQVTEKMRFTI